MTQPAISRAFKASLRTYTSPCFRTALEFLIALLLSAIVFSRRGELDRVRDSLSFHNRVNRVARHISHLFFQPAGPLDFHFLHCPLGAQPEMKPLIVRRQVTP